MIKELMFVGLIGISSLNSPIGNRDDERWADFYKQLAMSDIEEGRYDGAIFNLEKSLEYKESAENHKLLGGCYSGMGDSEKAVSELERSLALDYDASLATKLGKFYLSSGEADKALDKFTRIRNLIPNNPAALNNLGFAYSKIGEFDKAKELYENAINRCIEAGVEIDSFFFNAGINYYDLYKESKDDDHLFNALYYHFLAGYTGNEIALGNAKQLCGILIKKDITKWSDTDHINFNILNLRSVISYLENFNAESRKRTEKLRTKFMGVSF